MNDDYIRVSINFYGEFTIFGGWVMFSPIKENTSLDILIKQFFSPRMP